MPRVFDFRDYLSPLAAIWEWSPMTAYVIAVIIICIVYGKLIGWTRIKNFPRPFINVPILAVFLIGIPLYGFHQFMAFLTKVTISSDCNLSPTTLVMPSNGVIFEVLLPLHPESGGNGLAKFSGPSGKEGQIISGPFLYKCYVKNHGSTPIFNVDMDLHLVFKEVVTDGPNPGHSGKTMLTREWSIAMPEIGAGEGGMFVFYIANTSKLFAWVTLPPRVTFKPSNGDITVTELIQPPGLEMVFPP